MVSENKDLIFLTRSLTHICVSLYSKDHNTIYKFSMISLESKLWSGRRSVADGWCGSWWKTLFPARMTEKNLLMNIWMCLVEEDRGRNSLNWIRERVIIHGCSENWGVLCGGGSGLSTDLIHKMAAKGFCLQCSKSEGTRPQRARDSSESRPDVSHR